MNTSIVIDVVNGKITGVYSNEPDTEVTIFDGATQLTDEQEEEMDLLVAQHPYIIYR